MSQRQGDRTDTVHPGQGRSNRGLLPRKLSDSKNGKGVNAGEELELLIKEDENKKKKDGLLANRIKEGRKVGKWTAARKREKRPVRKKPAKHPQESSSQEIKKRGRDYKKWQRGTVRKKERRATPSKGNRILGTRRVAP